MTAMAAIVAMASLLLVAAAVPKVLNPGDTTRALRAAGLPAVDAVVRAGALAEAVLGGVTLIAGNPVTDGIMVASYLAFAGFVHRAIRQGSPLRTCGCFGTSDSPPTLLHVIVDLFFAGSCLAAALLAVPPARVVLAGRMPMAIPWAVLVALGSFLSYLLLAELPRLTAAIRGISPVGQEIREGQPIGRARTFLLPHDAREPNN